MDVNGISKEATKLHSDCLIWDMTLPWFDYGRRELKLQTLPRFKASGVDVVSLTVSTDGYGIEDTIRFISKERAYFRANCDKYTLAENVDDILEAKKAGKLAVIFNFQGSDPVKGDINLVEVYYKLGVRSILMAYNQKNKVGDGCHERTDCGLSRFGIELIQEMNRVGMLVDLSHTGYRTSMEAMEVSETPVIFSHSNARALWDHERNIRDDQAKACAKTGGVIGVNGVGTFLANNQASPEIMLNHINYYSELIGSEHVGIGLDHMYDWDTFFIEWISTKARYPGKGYDLPKWKFLVLEQLPELTEGLLKRGSSESEIRGILGENWLRVSRQVW